MSYVHAYDPDEEGRCREVIRFGDDGEPDVVCRSRQRSSVLHDDPEADFRERHWHGGGDCMCFEDPSGPSYHEAMRAYVRSQS